MQSFSEYISFQNAIGNEIQRLEDKASLSSTTFNRYNILENKASKIESFIDFLNLLTDHDEFPKSICSHFENGSQDPSFTCGGGASDLILGKHIFWRGCKTYDEDYKQYEFILENNHFKLI
jgi:isopenicillin-N N-acyltransferase-like protein